MKKLLILMLMLQVFMSGCVTSNKVKCSCCLQENNYIPYFIYGEKYNFLGIKAYPDKFWKVKALKIDDGEIKLWDNTSGNFARVKSITRLNLALYEKGNKNNTLFQEVVCLQDYPISEGDIIELYQMNWELGRLKIEEYNQTDTVGRQITFKNISNKKAKIWQRKIYKILKEERK